MEVIIPFLVLAGATVALMRGTRRIVAWRTGEYWLMLLPLLGNQLLAFTPLNRDKTLSNFFVEGLGVGCLLLVFILVRIAFFRNRSSSHFYVGEIVAFSLVILLVFCLVPSLPE
jgi:hypothetical protein